MRVRTPSCALLACFCGAAFILRCRIPAQVCAAIGRGMAVSDTGRLFSFAMPKATGSASKKAKDGETGPDPFSKLCSPTKIVQTRRPGWRAMRLHALMRWSYGFCACVCGLFICSSGTDRDHLAESQSYTQSNVRQMNSISAVNLIFTQNIQIAQLEIRLCSLVRPPLPDGIPPVQCY